MYQLLPNLKQSAFTQGFIDVHELSLMYCSVEASIQANKSMCIIDACTYDQWIVVSL